MHTTSIRPRRHRLRHAAAALLCGATIAGCNPAEEPPTPTKWQFVEVGAKAGVPWRHVPVNELGGDVYDHCAGVAVGDINGDGHEDIILLNQCGPPGYYLGKGDGTFTDASSRLAMLTGGVRSGITYGDYDNDGRIDLYVTFTRFPNMLLHQNADGTFTDVAKDKGVALSGHYSTGVFADVDKDGDLDLFVAGNIHHTTDTLVAADAARQCPAHYKDKGLLDILTKAGSDASALFINSGAAGGFAFKDEAAARGIPLGDQGADTRTDATAGFQDATVVDYDRDGHPDLMLAEMYVGRGVLLHNDGKGHFTSAMASVGMRPSFGPATITTADYDNNGWPDFFLTDMHSDMWIPPTMTLDQVDPGVRYMGPGGPNNGPGDNPTGPIFGNALWLGDGGTKFTESALDWSAETFQPWGNAPEDFDNDGLVDNFIASGMSNPYSYFPNMFLHNVGGAFEQMQTELGFDPPPNKAVDSDYRVAGQPYVSSARIGATGDFDENGTMDLVVHTWNNRVNLFRNDVPKGNHWLEVNLVGKAPRDPFGSFVEVKAGGKTYVRWMRGSGGLLSQSTRWIHFGLGAASSIDSVTVKWTDGTSSSVDKPAVDTRITVTHP